MDLNVKTYHKIYRVIHPWQWGQGQMPYRRLASTQKELTIDKICWARYNRFLEKDMSVQKLQSHSTMNMVSRSNEWKQTVKSLRSNYSPNIVGSSTTLVEKWNPMWKVAAIYKVTHPWKSIRMKRHIEDKCQL